MLGFFSNIYILVSVYNAPYRTIINSVKRGGGGGLKIDYSPHLLCSDTLVSVI